MKSTCWIAKIGALILILGTLAATHVEGKMMAPTQIPIARLLKNIGEYVRYHGL